VVSLNAGASRSGSGDANVSGSRASNSFQASIGATWEPDVWGRLRATSEGAAASAQASAADLASARLSAQGELAVAYFGLRQTDAQRVLLDDTIVGYERSLQITRNRYAAGVAARTDVLQAETQLANAQADAIGQARTRAQFEHAIRRAGGQDAGGVQHSAAGPTGAPRCPRLPVGLPSTLLQRRPDIAAAERRVAAANAQIGIAQSAFYPSLGLTGSLGRRPARWRAVQLRRACCGRWRVGGADLFDAGRHTRAGQTLPARPTTRPCALTARRC
jgi:NodT family efflux transporter outer membrane factor (OMF) lipoprotein